MTEKLNRVKEALLKVTDATYHYEAHKAKEPYIVWAEETESGALYGDDQKLEQKLQGTADLFTKTDGDPLIDQVQEQFATAKISYKLNSVQYEEETGMIHYEWIWEVD